MSQTETSPKGQNVRKRKKGNLSPSPKSLIVFLKSLM